MNNGKMFVLNGKWVSKKDFRKLCDALSYDHTIGGKFLLSKPLKYINFVPNPTDKNIAMVHTILAKYNVATDVVKCAVSTGYLPNLFEYKQVVRIIVNSCAEYAQYRDFYKSVCAVVGQRKK
ncbi:MAG: hypothetical protein J5679_00740 [Alphaproteobacteria bacterium]|nr:hypothetical protein [Alphaproteobacteria bacterium]